MLNKFLSTTSFAATNDRKEETDSVGFDKLRGFKEAPGGSGWEVPGWPSQARIYVRCGKGARQQLPRCVCKCRIQKEKRLGFFLEKIEKERKKKGYQNVKNAGKKSGGGNQSKTSVEGMGKVCWSS